MVPSTARSVTYVRTVHYEADDKGYRVVKEINIPIGNGPQVDPNGKADVSSSLTGSYSITADDIAKPKRKGVSASEEAAASSEEEKPEEDPIESDEDENENLLRSTQDLRLQALAQHLPPISAQSRSVRQVGEQDPTLDASGHSSPAVEVNILHKDRLYVALVCLISILRIEVVSSRSGSALFSSVPSCCICCSDSSANGSIILKPCISNCTAADSWGNA
uniref:Uncharacterized protein n=1 Tax=Anopheles culicifacies TaxID=139723 RepID=A0A182M6V6_9DIPT